MKRISARQQLNSRGLARSLRPRTNLLSWVIFSTIVVSHSGFTVVPLFAGLIWFICVYGVVVIYNDLSDIEVDKLNNRTDIPLVTGEVKQADLVRLMVSLSVVAVIAGSLLGSGAYLLMMMYLCLGWLYSGSANLKSKGVFAPIVLGLCYGVTPWLLGASVLGLGVTTEFAWIVVSSFIFTAGFVLLKDFKDLKGDRKTGKNTLLVLYGETAVRRIMLVTTSLAYVLLALVWFLNSNILGTCIAMLLLISNAWVLIGNAIYREPKMRAKLGGLSRAGFHIFSLVTYTLN